MLSILDRCSLAGARDRVGTTKLRWITCIYSTADILLGHASIRSRVQRTFHKDGLGTFLLAVQTHGRVSVCHGVLGIIRLQVWISLLLGRTFHMGNLRCTDSEMDIYSHGQPRDGRLRTRMEMSGGFARIRSSSDIQKIIVT